MSTLKDQLDQNQDKAAAQTDAVKTRHNDALQGTVGPKSSSWGGLYVIAHL